MVDRVAQALGIEKAWQTSGVVLWHRGSMADRVAWTSGMEGT